MTSWRTLRSELLLDRAPRLRIFADDVELPDGRVVEGYLRAEGPDFAMVVPLTADGQVVLVRSYKRGLDAVDLQPPAGMIDAGESAAEAAQRELLEETGYRADELIPLGAYVLGGNLGWGRAHLFLAAGCRKVAEPDAGDLEQLEVVLLPLVEARRRWLGGADFGQLVSAAALGLALARPEAAAPAAPAPVDEDDRRQIQALLEETRALTLATTDPDGAPRATPLYFAAGPDLELLFLSDPDSPHSRNLQREPRAAAAAFPAVEDWRAIRGVQIRGLVRPLDEAEHPAGMRIYRARFGDLAGLEVALAGSRLYRLRPSWLRLIDNRRGFGFKREWGTAP